MHFSPKRTEWHCRLDLKQDKDDSFSSSSSQVKLNVTEGHRKLWVNDLYQERYKEHTSFKWQYMSICILYSRCYFVTTFIETSKRNHFSRINKKEERPWIIQKGMLVIQNVLLSRCQVVTFVLLGLYLFSMIKLINVVNPENTTLFR